MIPVMRLSSALMKVLGPARVPGAAVLLLLGAGLPARAARHPRPDLSIALEPLGFGTIPPAYLASGQTMFTLNFVDDTHLLLTFNTKGLMPRLDDAQADDDDRNVAAVLLDTGTGKVVARTTWRTRDHGRYLWPVGGGRFLLRVRGRFSMVDPMRNLAAGDAFAQTKLLETTRSIALVQVSADGGLLMVETAPPQKAALLGAAASAAALAAASAAASTAAAPEPRLKQREGPPPTYELHFYRLLQTSGGRPVAQSAGGVRATQPIEIAMTAQGYLSVVKESSGVYDFDFHTNSGRKLELSPYETSCAPRATFISLTDFVAFGCRGGTTPNELSAFNLRGEEPWITVLPGTQLATFLRNAPAAGRFALGLTSSMPVSIPGSNDDSIRTPGEQVQVMQHHDGRVLLTVSAAPVQLSGQNFDLSPDGLEFAAVQGKLIGIYRLPEVSRADRGAMTLSAAALNEPAAGPVRLEVLASGGTDRAKPGAKGGKTAAGGGLAASAPQEDSVAADAAQGGGGTKGAAAAPAARAGGAGAAPALAATSAAASAVPRGAAAGSGVQASGVAATPNGRAGAGSEAGAVNGDASSDADVHRKPPTLYDADHPKPPSP